MKTWTRATVIAAYALVMGASFAQAQTWSLDARSAALGGLGPDGTTLIGASVNDRPERAIVIPLGLLQLLRDRDIFKASSAQFDPVRAAQYATNPMQFEFGRTGGHADVSFIRDLRNGAFKPDLRSYQGFVPATMTAAGLINPKYGKTIALPASGAMRHSVFIGGGPHLALDTRVDVDPALSNILSGMQTSVGGTDRYGIANRSHGQAAAALTAGYRTRRQVGDSGSQAFLAANFNYLIGIRYEDVGVRLDLDTDARGLVMSGVASGVAPLTIQRRSSSSGRGVSLDLGGGLMMGPWNIAFTGDNLASHISWRSATDRSYALNNLFGANARFNGGPRSAAGDVRVEGEPDYRGSLGYRMSVLSLYAEVQRYAGFTYVREGAELRLPKVEVRAALTHRQGTLSPSAGVSVPAGRRLWIDLAGFTTAANVERVSRFAVAASVRLALQAQPLATQ